MTLKKLIAFSLMTVMLVACGKSRTEKLLWNKKWGVYNVTPPDNGTFDVEASDRAQELKNGFYKDTWFQFTEYGLFRASFGGKVDSGKYTISYDGQIISLYPLKGNKMYEQIQVKQLTRDKFDFNTVIADFHMTLHTKNISQ